ncbi:MAG: aminopeptidase N [Burkholderiaceae bacterium]
MREGNSPLVRREDYTAPAYWIRAVDLSFDLEPAKTLVINRMRIVRNRDLPAQALRLHGEELNLSRVLVNGESVSFRHEAGELAIDDLPQDEFTLEIRNTCAPEKNTRLSGLYTSGGGFFTQCEAEGFRRITFFLDRPDVMAVYTVLLRANKSSYPVLLSNGNLVEAGDLDGGRHFAKWHDPFPKPSYLFALVGADLVAREQRVRSRSGKEHLLQVYVRRGDLEKTQHAMNSLVAALAWDEARFNLALDLERFMIVAVSDFNSGAMENKGLNIFNTRFVLASPATATDSDFAAIESVVGHEYFHNWTGNRVTCRDWFQLSLKEGLTVFRDQEFSMDMAGSASARAVKRIDDVSLLREHQFSEDAGPMAHPVRPDSYVSINNFYTKTVYEKGAEVVRMMYTLVGRDGFAAGMRLYFERFDAQAVTCDDFAQAIADANPGSALATRLEAFKRWYSQSGTPRVTARGRYDAAARSYTLDFEQQVVSSSAAALPQVIPLEMGLLSRDGHALPLRMAGADDAAPTQRLLVLDQARASFSFVDIDSEPIASLLRGFCAPVMLDDGLDDAELLVLLEHDSDPFNRWEAAQRLAMRRLLAAISSEGGLQLDPGFILALRSVLRHASLDAAFKERVLTPPSESYVAEQLESVDPQRVHAVREAYKLQIAQGLRDDWVWAFESHEANGAYSPDANSAGRRSLAHLALAMLCLDSRARAETHWPECAEARFHAAGNMTDCQGALAALIDGHSDRAGHALRSFYERFRSEPLAIDKWFTMHALAPERDGLVFARVRALLQHPDFSLLNPNRVRSLVSAFCNFNPAAFHRADAAGYVFWCEQVLALDAINPQIAARLARVMDRWSRLAPAYRGAAREAISRVAARGDLSADVREIVTHALQSH